MRFRVAYPHFERLGRPAAMRKLNFASQESFRVFNRCLTSLMQIAFFQAKNDYFSDIYEVVPEAIFPITCSEKKCDVPPRVELRSAHTLRRKLVAEAPKSGTCSLDMLRPICLDFRVLLPGLVDPPRGHSRFSKCYGFINKLKRTEF